MREGVLRRCSRLNSFARGTLRRVLFFVLLEVRQILCVIDVLFYIYLFPMVSLHALWRDLMGRGVGVESDFVLCHSSFRYRCLHMAIHGLANPKFALIVLQFHPR